MSRLDRPGARELATAEGLPLVAPPTCGGTRMREGAVVPRLGLDGLR